MFDDAYCEWLQEKAIRMIVCCYEKNKDKVIERCDKSRVTNDTDAKPHVDMMNEEAPLQLARRRGAFLLDMGPSMNCDIRTYGVLCVHQM